MYKKRLNIIYEDKYIIVVDKPNNLLTISTEKEKEKTLYRQVQDFEKRKNKNNKIFIVHRLDRDTSGLVVFAKSKEVKYLLQNNWNSKVLLRNYIAVVEGKIIKTEDTIKSYLIEDKNFKTISTKDSQKGKLAITSYKVLNTSKSYSLLNITIQTGRKNQIRVHLKDIGHPIVGDKKYGAKTNPTNRLMLHANILIIKHPISNEIIKLESKIPSIFTNIFKKS